MYIKQPNLFKTFSIIYFNVFNFQEADGASEDRSEKGSEDDDLTSLTWLQDKNLLKGIHIF